MSALGLYFQTPSFRKYFRPHLPDIYIWTNSLKVNVDFYFYFKYIQYIYTIYICIVSVYIYTIYIVYIVYIYSIYSIYIQYIYSICIYILYIYLYSICIPWIIWVVLYIQCTYLIHIFMTNKYIILLYTYDSFSVITQCKYHSYCYLLNGYCAYSQPIALLFICYLYYIFNQHFVNLHNAIICTSGRGETAFGC